MSSVNYCAYISFQFPAKLCTASATAACCLGSIRDSSQGALLFSYSILQNKPATVCRAKQNAGGVRDPSLMLQTIQNHKQVTRTPAQLFCIAFTAIP